MRTKLVSIGLAIVFVAASFNLVLAQKPTPGATPPGRSERHPTPKAPQPEGKGGKPHGIFGTITVLGSNSFTVSTKLGNETVNVSAATKFHIPAKRNATFSDLAVGDRVTVNGTPTANGLDAKQVAVAPSKPTIRHRVGKVTAYTPGSSITIQDAQGGSETFALNAQTVIRNPKGTGVAVGDQVTVVSRRDPNTSTFTASAIVVHPH